MGYKIISTVFFPDHFASSDLGFVEMGFCFQKVPVPIVFFSSGNVCNFKKDG